jgi:hypothetical protein
MRWLLEVNDSSLGLLLLPWLAGLLDIGYLDYLHAMIVIPVYDSCFVFHQAKLYCTAVPTWLLP